MATEISIVSNALLMLGQSPIAAFTESPLAANLWPQIRDATMRAHPWNCLVRRRILAPDATPPDFDYPARFLLPEDWVRTLQVGEDGAPIDYQAEGRYLVANETALPLRYVAQVNDPGAWDNALCHAMSLGMAAAMAYPVTKSASLAEVMEGRFNKALQQAATIDGQDEPPQTLGDFPLLASRYRGLRTFRR